MVLADQTYITTTLDFQGTTNITTTELDQASQYGDSEVYGRTGITAWSGSEVNFPRARMAANLFAMAMIKRKYEDRRDSAQADFDTAVAICAAIVAEEEDAEGEEAGTPLIVSGSYQTQPANPDAPYVFATRSRGGAATYKDVLNGFR
jgi:hypothetical protein